MKKLKVAVLMGGNSPEHEISLMSGNEVLKNLDEKKYDIVKIQISRDGNTWQVEERNKLFLDSPASKKKNNKKTKTSGQLIPSTESKSLIKGKSVDLIFIAMHGAGGEDGKIQGFLDLIEVPYTGSNVVSSALAMDKSYSRILFTHAGLNVPKSITIDKPRDTNGVWKTLKLPVFVKPSSAGSSVGISKVKRKSDLKKAVNTAFKYSDKVIVDEFLDGTEITCAILGNKNPIALPLVEIVTKKEFFDYEAKYSEQLTDEIVPARISKSLTTEAQKVALAAYKALGCSGFGRVDMIIRKGKVYVLEVNTIPGLTPVSLLPKAAKSAGISYSKLLDKIISLAKNKENAS